MRREWNEIEKNMGTCTIMMLVVGISLFIMGKTNGGIICVLIAIVFAGILVGMLVKNPGEQLPKKDASEKKMNRVDEETDRTEKKAEKDKEDEKE